MHSIIVLGPDRVGKSTIIQNTSNLLTEAGYDVATLHFREVQPHHHSPIDQYYEHLGNMFEKSHYLLIDRFVPDTLFYESHRANFPPINPTLARTVESMLIQHSDRIDVVHLAPNWSDEISERHREEIKSKYPNCTEYWTSICLERSRIEHRKYNEFVSEYFLNGNSLLPTSNYHLKSSPTDKTESVFHICPSIPAG